MTRDTKTARQDGVPAFVDGAVIRLMTDGETTWVETWGPHGWERGGSTVREYLMGPPASAETLACLGVPRRDWGL